MKKLLCVIVTLLPVGCGSKEASWNGKPESSWRESLLDSDDVAARREAAKALGELGSKAKESVPELITALKDNDGKVRREAARALWSMTDRAKDAVWDLINALHDPEADVRLNAAGALGDIGKDGRFAIAELARALK